MNPREGLAPRSAWKRWTHAPILRPIFLQVLGGLLALAAAGGALERDEAAATIGSASRPEMQASGSTRTSDQRDGPSRAPSRDDDSEESDKVPPAGAPDSGSVPAGVQLLQGPWPDSSRPAAGPRIGAHDADVPVSGLRPSRDRLAALPAHAASSPLGGSLSPLSPRGPPSGSGRRSSMSDPT